MTQRFNQVPPSRRPGFGGDDQFDKFFNNAAKNVERGFKYFWVVWIVAALASLAVVVAVIWGIVQVVQAVTG